MSVMRTVEEVTQLIRSGAPLLLAGDERVLSRLPSGNWIGGTIPYFMAAQGGVFSQDRIHVTELPSFIKEARIRIYDSKSVESVYLDCAENGFSLIVIPGFSRTHQEFALNAPKYRGFASHILIGWIAGFDLKDVGRASAKVYDGRSGQAIPDGAAVLHVSLPAGKVADVGTVNIFEQSEGDEIEFEADGFSAKHAIINGEQIDFVDYMKSKAIDLKLPLVADYLGMKVNISFQAVDSSAVQFYAPVFRGIRYRQAAHVTDYMKEFNLRAAAVESGQVSFSCNCILNYLYAGLEGKKTLSITGPVTFGEICYQLLNQTLVYLTIQDV